MMIGLQTRHAQLSVHLQRAFSATFFLCFLGFNFSAVAGTPLVPITSFLYHWDHHWYIWLPGDPVYEAVEIMAAERPKSGPLVWVFFTERNPPKHQTHYFNDALAAAAGGGQVSDIAFKMTGAEGEPRGVSVAFTNNKAQKIAIDVGINSQARLTTAHGGLTNQIGHSADRLFLIFFRETAAYADTWSVAIDGVNVAVAQPGQNHPAPFPASYSHNIFVAGFPFGDRRIDFGNAGIDGNSDVAHFIQTAGADSFQTTLPDRSRIEISTEKDGSLKYYRHFDSTGGHTLEIKFDPPLQPSSRLLQLADSAFAISLDGFHDLLSGVVQANRGMDAVTLEWRFEKPDWARARSLLSTLSVKDGDVSEINLRPKLQ
jgi:hypothetical protein